MASILKVDKLDPQSGTALEIGTSGDTITVPTGAGLTVTDEVKTNKISPATGVAFALGDSGDTFTVPSGATIVNSGTATGFGGDNTPAFHAYSSADQTSISDGVFTTIEFGTELYDSDGCYDTGTFKFTPTTAGKYFTYASFVADSGSSPTLSTAGITIEKNTTDVTYAFVDHRGNVTGRSGYPNAMTTVDMDGSSDYLIVKGYMSPGGTFASGAYVTYFGAYKLIT